MLRLDNNINGSGASALAEENLNLYDNEIGDEGAGALVKVLKGISTLAEALQINTGLQNLSLSGV
ncbi:hypothetical protein BC936DRAFT_140436 [Jimgerdemannia flammicorona]|uniref:Uncharacterized protein n=1 Tax=Jimgerdemannia flammicorona TaxID=994334 RepID=A0A433AU72_9FUNG|nr:hypothetical protein BC936DRAFT_140436 [Jimgerdemannia flammicorona]